VRVVRILFPYAAPLDYAMNLPDTPAAATPHPLVRTLGAVLWPSFFAAAAMASGMFAFWDPLELQRIGFPSLSLSRGQGYTLGFFCLWLGTLCACGVTALLLRPSRAVEEPYE